MVSLFSCTTLNQQSSMVVLNEALSYQLTPPPASLINRQMQQLLLVKFQQQNKQLIVQTEFQADSIVLAAISTTGVPLFDLTWQANDSLNVKKYLPLPDFDPRRILVDLQWVYWPEAQLKSALVGKNIELTSVKNEQGKRVISQHGKTLVTIEHTQSNIIINHFDSHYQIIITPLEPTHG